MARVCVCPAQGFNFGIIFIFKTHGNRSLRCSEKFHKVPRGTFWWGPDPEILHLVSIAISNWMVLMSKGFLKEILHHISATTSILYQGGYLIIKNIIKFRKHTWQLSFHHSKHICQIKTVFFSEENIPLFSRARTKSEFWFLAKFSWFFHDF